MLRRRCGRERRSYHSAKGFKSGIVENDKLNADVNFEAMLRNLRRNYGMSQLELALECGCSQRHLSFLESGRSGPSRTMIMALSEAMGIPLRQRNDLMLAAGFAPTYSEYELSDPELNSVSTALDQMLLAHNPYPAFVFDWRHDIIAANQAAISLQLFLFDAARPEDLPDCASNVMRGLLHPDGYRDHIANWEHVASVMLRRFRAEILALGKSDEGGELLEEFSACVGESARHKFASTENHSGPMLTVDIDKGGTAFSVFSILSSLGAPFDVTLQEIRIESFYPADTAGDDFFKRLA